MPKGMPENEGMGKANKIKGYRNFVDYFSIGKLSK